LEKSSFFYAELRKGLLPGRGDSLVPPSDDRVVNRVIKQEVPPFITTDLLTYYSPIKGDKTVPRPREELPKRASVVLALSLRTATLFPNPPLELHFDGFAFNSFGHLEE